MTFLHLNIHSKGCSQFHLQYFFDRGYTHRIVIPDIDGYKTLKGELHIHTVFSDASVWPTTRIDEAMTEGLDFIAITDHVDARLLKQKNKGLMDFDRNESYKIAASAGKSHDVLVIHGGEISRGMPPDISTPFSSATARLSARHPMRTRTTTRP